MSTMRSCSHFRCERWGPVPWTKERDFSNHSYIDIYGISIVLLINPCASASWCPLLVHQLSCNHYFSLKAASVSSSRTGFEIYWTLNGLSYARIRAFSLECSPSEEKTHSLSSFKGLLLVETTLKGTTSWCLSFFQERCWGEYTPSWNDTHCPHGQLFLQLTCLYSESWPSSLPDYCTVSMLATRLTWCSWTKFRSDFEWSLGTCPRRPCYPPQWHTWESPRAADCRSSTEQVGCCRRKR